MCVCIAVNVVLEHSRRITMYKSNLRLNTINRNIRNERQRKNYTKNKQKRELGCHSFCKQFSSFSLVGSQTNRVLWSIFPNSKRKRQRRRWRWYCCCCCCAAQLSMVLDGFSMLSILYECRIRRFGVNLNVMLLRS